MSLNMLGTDGKTIDGVSNETNNHNNNGFSADDGSFSVAIETITSQLLIPVEDESSSNGTDQNGGTEGTDSIVSPCGVDDPHVDGNQAMPPIIIQPSNLEGTAVSELYEATDSNQINLETGDFTPPNGSYHYFESVEHTAQCFDNYYSGQSVIHHSINIFGAIHSQNTNVVNHSFYSIDEVVIPYVSSNADSMVFPNKPVCTGFEL